jgi:hypothetical protein
MGFVPVAIPGYNNYLIPACGNVLWCTYSNNMMLLSAKIMPNRITILKPL